MNILIVSFEAWRDTNNGGNVLSNIFRAFPDADIAQIYCSGELPHNSVCQKYFQIADSMLLKGAKGHVLEEKTYSETSSSQLHVADNKIKDRIPNVFREPALLAREFLWTFSNWKTKELEKFVLDFHPDIIFAPCYSYYHVSKLALHVKSIAKCPMISYISDDNYSLRQMRVSPSFWINRLITRKWIRRHFQEAAFVYTMTDLQKTEYEALLKRPMKVLCKSAEFSERKKKVSNPVQIIYAGGLYLNRWKILRELANVLEKINTESVKAELHIYSTSKLNTNIEKSLNDRRNSFLHDPISYEELIEKYMESDIAIHVESFDIKNRLITRLSFSTKIIDCLSSGCAVLAIGPNTQAGISYLKEHDGAVCVNNVKDLYAVVKDLVSDTQLIEEYSEKAYKLGKLNHQKQNIEEKIKKDFDEVVATNIG